MADLKISQLTSATLPLAGTEVLPIVQSSTTKKVATDDLTVKNLRSNATTGILQIAGPAAAATRTMTVPDANFTAARTDAAQSFTGDQTLSTGNLVQGTAAKGVNFTANTPAAGMTSQLLNWYEEGTWTPEFSVEVNLSGSWTYTTQTGYYTRIGNMVRATFSIATSAKPSAGDIVRINLPITSSRNASVQGFVSAVGGITFTSRNIGAGATQIALQNYSTQYCQIILLGSGRAYADNISVSSMDAASNITGVLIYEA